MFKSLSVVFFLLPSVSFADGITEMLIAPYTDPCLEQILSKPEYELQIEGYKFIINFLAK